MHPDAPTPGPTPSAAPSAAPTATAGPTGVIHDIGYRHHAGARLGRAAILRALFVQSLRSTYGLGRTAKSKVLPFALLAVMLMPALVLEVILIFARSQENVPAELVPSDQLLAYARYVIVLQAAIGIFVAAQAPVLFSRDQRFRSITLYFSRPLTRLDYVLAKYAALVVALLILMAAPLLVMYIGGLLAKLPADEQTADFALALVGVVLFALVLAGVGGLLASITPRRGFGVAAIITVLAVSFGGVNTVAGILQSFGNETAAGYLGLFSPISLVDGVQSLALGADYSGVEAPPDGLLGTAIYFVWLTIVVLGCFGLLLLRYRKVASA